jgi:hypothetical protein
MFALVLEDGKTSKPLPLSNGVKQDCVIAPTLFSMMFSAMLSDAVDGKSVGLPFPYRSDGKFFNLRRLQAKTKVQEDTANYFLFADDCALNAESQPAMQQRMDQFSTTCDN